MEKICKPKTWKREIAKTTKLSCFWCHNVLSVDKATVDHVIGSANGGQDDPDNYVIACNNCNGERSLITTMAIWANRIKNQNQTINFHRHKKTKSRFIKFREKTWTLLQKWVNLYKDKITGKSLDIALEEIKTIICLK